MTDNTTKIQELIAAINALPAAITEDDIRGIVQDELSSLPTITLTGVDADGVTHTYTIYGS